MTTIAIIILFAAAVVPSVAILQRVVRLESSLAATQQRVRELERYVDRLAADAIRRDIKRENRRNHGKKGRRK